MEYVGMDIAVALHVLAVAVWVGGMAFAVLVLRHAIAPLAPPQRLAVLSAAIDRFVPIVGVAIVVIVGSGAWLVPRLGGFAALPAGAHGMIGLGVVMIAVYAWLVAVPARALRRALAATDWTRAARSAATARGLITLNLVLGVVAIVVGVAGAPR